MKPFGCETYEITRKTASAQAGNQRYQIEMNCKKYGKVGMTLRASLFRSDETDWLDQRIRSELSTYFENVVRGHAEDVSAKQGNARTSGCDELDRSGATSAVTATQDTN